LSGAHIAVLGLATIALVYFVALNSIYLAFTGVAWRSITRHLRRERYLPLDEIFASPLTPGVSVLVPAYNEEVGIVESVRSLLDLRYPTFEVIVVNDGSADATLERLTEAYDLHPVRKALRSGIRCAAIRGTYVSRRHRNLWVVDKENGGKADALNAGAVAASYPFVCALDADGVLEPDALLRVIRPVLDDPELVVATGGIVRIANGCTVENGRITRVGLPRNRLAAIQVVEYFRAFLVGRVGWSRVNALLIISGAFGLFRRDHLEAVGGWSHETIGEDVELVVRLHRHMTESEVPYRIEFVPDPVCWTEAPETLAVLASQRRRWHRGLGETLWRHRRLIGNPRYRWLGLGALPYFLLFEFLGPLVELLGPPSIVVWWALGLLSLRFFVAFLVVSLLLGFLISVAALSLEEFSFNRHPAGRDVARLVWLAAVENLGYRQLTAVWRVHAFFQLLLKRTTSWGNMERRGLTRHPASVQPVSSQSGTAAPRGAVNPPPVA
jgi:cellulose synthase/poly-beta-1,6-N-acetylglucosamine synthase-like glycosyltransferase